MVRLSENIHGFYSYYRPLTATASGFGAALVVCLIPAVTFESLGQETSFLVCRYTFIISRLLSYIKVIGLRSKSQVHKAGYTGITKYTHLGVVGLRLLAADRQTDQGR